ncbi:putative calcium-binding protein CML35 [Curcuma longa]|uniref:putative calcium-binding protein CML35 n=1 Tax=Curcuma longa TaxID=136217 RepID=UPI003D9EF235
MTIIDSFLRSFQKKTKSKKKKSRGLSVTSSSFSSSSSDDYSIVSAAAALQTTPRSVLPASSSFLRDFFALFDRDGDGKITRLEVESVLRRLAPAHDPPTAEEVASMVAEVDRDGDGCISLDEFAAVEAALVAGSGAAGDDEQELMREAFAVFDADGDGKISAEELHGVFDLLFGDRECTVEECRRMIRGVDTDGDGFVGFDEFATMMMMDGAEAF